MGMVGNTGISNAAEAVDPTPNATKRTMADARHRHTESERELELSGDIYTPPENLKLRTKPGVEKSKWPQ